MFDSRSPIIKIGGYIIVGFFVLIIIISFGMPDFMSRLGIDKSTVAIVNGEKIQYLDFLRYRDMVAGRVKDSQSKEFQQYLLDSLIRYRLQLQKGKAIGIKVSDERVKRAVKEIPIFRDKSGRFSPEYLNRFLDHFNMSLSDYYVMMREELINAAIVEMLRMGAGASPEEIRAQAAIRNSRIMIKYCYVANSELKNRMRGAIAVSEAEIDRELAKNRAEIKDPKTDRERIRTKLEDRKFEAGKKALIEELDRLSVEGRPFEAAASRMGGKVSLSREFKIGEPVREASAKGEVLHTINDSPVFVNDCLALGTGKSSRAVNAFDGLYVFTPVRKDVVMKDPAPSERESIENALAGERVNAVYMSMMAAYLEKSRISKNLNTN